MINYTQFYENISSPWRKLPQGNQTLTRIDAVLRIAVAAGFVVLLLWLAFADRERLVRALVVPTATFALVTALRALINAPRPYEAFSITPLIYKSTRGKSMPSRHMASATIIACTILWAVGPTWGIVALVACVAIAYVRIVGGVHFPRDIVAAALISTLCAAVGFIAIP